jgi:hypothetical protein
MDAINLTTQQRSHGSDIRAFTIKPYGVTPPPVPSWLWVAAPLALIAVAGLGYFVLKK